MEPPQFLKDKAPPKGTVLSIGSSLKEIGLLSIPIFSQQFLRFAQVVVNFAFIAHYDDPYMLGGLGLGMSFYVIFNMSFFIGFNSAITTFAA
jgi:Na+-driven multidrug efflux pump